MIFLSGTQALLPGTLVTFFLTGEKFLHSIPHYWIIYQLHSLLFQVHATKSIWKLETQLSIILGDIKT